MVVVRIKEAPSPAHWRMAINALVAVGFRVSIRRRGGCTYRVWVKQ